MKLLALSLSALWLCSCAATRPAGRAMTSAALKLSNASVKPFNSVVDKVPPFPVPVRIPLLIVTYPPAVVGTCAAFVIFVPGMMLSGY